MLFRVSGNIGQKIIYTVFSVFRVLVTVFIAVVGFTTGSNADKTADITGTAPCNSKDSQDAERK